MTKGLPPWGRPFVIHYLKRQGDISRNFAAIVASDIKQSAKTTAAIFNAKHLIMPQTPSSIIFTVTSGTTIDILSKKGDFPNEKNA